MSTMANLTLTYLQQIAKGEATKADIPLSGNGDSDSYTQHPTETE